MAWSARIATCRATSRCAACAGRSSTSNPSARRTRSRTARPATPLITGGVTLAVALLLGAFFATRLTRPLAALARHADAIATGGGAGDAPAIRGPGEIGVLAQRVDEMARRIAERSELQHALARGDRLASVGVMSAQVAHEINNPLTTVLGYAKLLLEDKPEGHADRAALEMIADEAERMKKIIGGLLEYARAPRASAPSVTGAVTGSTGTGTSDPATVVRHVGALLEPQLRKARAKLATDVTTAQPLAIEAHALQQVLVNLVQNSAQAMAEAGDRGGAIAIATRPAPGGIATLITVSDDGPGIPPADRARVFDPFYTTKAAGVGTGLGLAVCRHLIATAGGSIEVGASPTGRGAEFRVVIPNAHRCWLMSSILVVDDERGIRSLCSEVLTRASHEVETVDCAAGALAAIARRRFDLVLCDINLPDQDGVSLLPKLLVGEQPPAVLLITAYPSIDTAVRGMKLGARDYIGKPFSPDELRMVVSRALAEDELRRAHGELTKRLAYGSMIGESPAMQQLRATIDKVAQSDATVLITGESGTGKELVARALHFAGRRAGRAFVPVNCGALVGTLLDSELFGHVRGAFTGADTAKRGLFVAADGGTLFLDEIGELPLDLQPKLLRALQDGEVKPVGGTTAIRVDARVIAATNRSLQHRVAEGEFREDLFYRLAVITIEVPPLRSRPGDIGLLARHFAEQAALRAERGRMVLTDAAIAHLAAQPWPGNVRELENAIERAVILTAGDVLDAGDVASTSLRPLSPSPGLSTFAADHIPTLDELERTHILRVLELCEGQKTKAAAMLGINRTTLWKKLRTYGIEDAAE